MTLTIQTTTANEGQSKGNETGDIDFDFTPTSEQQATYSWQLPALKADSYTVEWIAIGGDGHKVKSTFSFMVH